MQTALKAYAVTEEDEGTGGIVFAKHSVVARREGAGRYGDGDFHSVSCRRASWADSFAETGQVPASIAINNGWWFYCDGCGDQINSDRLHDRRLPLEGVSGFVDSRVYCCKTCRTKAERRERRRAKEQTAAIEMLKAMVLERFPGVTFQDGRFRQHAYCTEHKGVWVIEDATVSFDFPGMKFGPASLRMHRGYYTHERVGPIMPEYSCCNGDREAFEAFVQSLKS